MKKSNRLWVFTFLYLILTLFTSCEPTEKTELIPVITTTKVSSTMPNSAISGGLITSDGGLDITSRGVCWSTTINPTTADNKSNDGSGIGVYSSTLTGLTTGVTYYVRAYAINSSGTGYGNVYSFTHPFLITFNSNLNYGSVTDIDGNVYKTIVIGNQTWMAENLRTTKYRNGVAIPNITVVEDKNWSSLVTGAWCNYEDDEASIAKYGNLYNWYAVIDSLNILAPIGWHVPSDLEWSTLAAYLGGDSIAGGKLKEIGTLSWFSPNVGANNESGFSAIPGGGRSHTGALGYFGSFGYWWSTTKADDTYAWNRGMFFNARFVGRYNCDKRGGLSVRCVKD